MPNSIVRTAAAIGVAALVAQVAPAEVMRLGDFESGTWPGLQRSDTQARQGKYSGKWVPKQDPTIRIPDIPTNWTGFERLVFWLYSEKANGQRLTLVCNSENPADTEGWDYFFLHIQVDWQGWKLFDVGLGTDIVPTRKPAGWHKIDYCSFNAGGWQHQPLADTVLYIDDVKLTKRDVSAELRPGDRKVQLDGGLTRDWPLLIANRSTEPRMVRISARRKGAKPDGRNAFRVTGVPGGPVSIPAGDTRTWPLTVSSPGRVAETLPPLLREEFIVSVEANAEDTPPLELALSGTVPLGKRKHPFLFGGPALFARARARATRYEWAKTQFERNLQAADGWVAAPLRVPDEPGQWSHHYVCKKCGARLRPVEDKHVCSRCKEEYTGWPYDQVIAGAQHGRNWGSIKALGLAYALTGAEKYAAKAREILLAYADKYTGYPLHNIRGRKSSSAARIYAQTLDEAVAVIGVAWGYDLVYNSPCLSAKDKERIESRFLREVVATIIRNNAGISNWQSWHNAGTAAVGFCLQDEDIVAESLYGRSGLAFQLKKSILADGFWYEGTAAYHYYALDAIRWTTEAAHHAGFDFWNDPGNKALYDAPLYYVFPDLRFPAVNDSDIFSITGRHGLYELAYARLNNPAYVVVAQHGKRSSVEALLWGADELPPAPALALDSRDFKGLGAVVLRQGEGPDQLYAHLDYGPHGGGHGHPDKLTLILYGLGRQLAPDPGRLAYGAPLQGSWYRQTFAHNTVCVDERSQAATQGTLTLFHSEPGFAVARADSDAAYPGVLLKRTVVLTPHYVLDVFDAESDTTHTYDWLYHNFGEARPGFPVSALEGPLAEGSGYQHVQDVTEGQPDGNWQVDFTLEDANVRLLGLAEPGTSVFIGNGMANNPPSPCPVAVVRRKADKTRFVAVMAPYRELPPTLSAKVVDLGQPGTLSVKVTRGNTEEWVVLRSPDAEPLTVAGVRVNGQVAFVSREPGAGTTVVNVP